MLTNGKNRGVEFRVFLRGRRYGKTLLRSFASSYKYNGVWECVEFVIAGWCKVKIVLLYNLKWEQEMRNLASGDLICTEND